jgi:hypothetical protein
MENASPSTASPTNDSLISDSVYLCLEVDIEGEEERALIDLVLANSCVKLAGMSLDVPSCKVAGTGCIGSGAERSTIHHTVCTFSAFDDTAVRRGCLKVAV